MSRLKGTVSCNPATRIVGALSILAAMLFLGGCGSNASGGHGPIPPQLSYTTTSAVYTRTTAITPNTPINIGGPITSYAVQPALPAGLTLDTTTGVISGTPTAVTAQAVYTVTGSNVAWDCQSRAHSHGE